MMELKMICTVGWLLFTVQVLSGQKIEVEKKIPESMFPPTALAYLEGQFPDRGRSRYYLESDPDSINFEAKFKWEGHCYSVEFFNGGAWKDTEKEINFADLPASLRQTMEAAFARDFKKSKVKRVQQQTVPDRSTLRYELEVKGKNETGWAMWEYLFEANGELVEKLKIILPSNNILLY